MLFYYCISIIIIFVIDSINSSNIIDNDKISKIKQTNLIFLIFDDLRTELSVYDRNHMITPNFERLAKRSVIFDKAYTQVSVCNPARDSLMTGLRPDTTGTYGFQSSFRPHLIFPQQLARSGYNTAGFGKISHWETPDRQIWNFDSWENGWYKYQNFEWTIMNSSTMPDKIRPEELFRDYQFTSRAIDSLKKMSKLPKHFLLALGFKLPHLAIHVPYKYYEMYKGEEKSNSWKLTKKELRYPYSSPELSYRCCNDKNFHFMNNEGALPSEKRVAIGDINAAFTDIMHDELMKGYCAAITFVDKQLGRLLDAVDELNLWDNTTIILTADHGQHNGEKGLWEKWSLFDESTRVPLFISHPLSPNMGKHYTEPVELLDIYPTINDILKAPYDKSNICKEGTVCNTLQGKSLANLVLGNDWNINIKNNKKKYVVTNNSTIDEFSSIKLNMDYAISQNWRCARKELIMQAKTKQLASISSDKVQIKTPRNGQMWFDCDKTKNPSNEISVMGYSMRSSKYRYTSWFHYDRIKCIPIIDVAPFEEELYDHIGETLADFTHQEIINLANKPMYKKVLSQEREKLINFIREKIIFRGPFQ